MLLSVLLRQEQGLNHTKNQEIKGHLNSRSNTEIRKLDQNVAQRSECSHMRSEGCFYTSPESQEHGSRSCKAHVT